MDHVLDKLSTALHGDSKKYNATPPTAGWFAPTGPAAPTAPPAAPQKRLAPDHPSKPAAKRQSSGASTERAERQESDKKKGIFICSTHPLQHLAHYFDSLGGKPLCSKFCTRGYFCNAPPGKCHRAHVTSLNKLPPNDRKVVNRWVANTESVSFAPGQEPQQIGKNIKKENA